MADSYKISRPAPRDPAGEFVHDPLFSVDRRHNAVDINPRVNNYVRVVSSDPDEQMLDAVRAVGAHILGPQYPYARAGFVRSALRPASRADGRGRFRA